MRTLFLMLVLLPALPTHALEPLVIYSERKPFLIEPLLAEYTRETGQPVKVLSDQASVLIERLTAEGKYTQADILMTVDAGSLWLAGQRGQFRPMASAIIAKNIPAHLRDPQDATGAFRWTALSLRARTMLVNPAKLDPKLALNYADLATPAFKGKLCLRSSKKIYNQSLIAMMIRRDGEVKVEQMVRGWVANLAAPPFADDTLVVNAVASGQCAVGIINTYYFGRAEKDNPAMKALKLVWADQAGSGVHVNVSGAGIVKNSNQAAAAQRLIEWLSGAKAQALFAQSNLEYPANPVAALDPIVAGWGKFKSDQTHMTSAGALQAKAVRLMDRAGWK